MKRILLAVVLLAVSLSVHADFKTGLVAYQRGDFVTAPAQYASISQPTRAADCDEIGSGELARRLALGCQRQPQVAAERIGIAAQRGKRRGMLAAAGARFQPRNG